MHYSNIVTIEHLGNVDPTTYETNVESGADFEYNRGVSLVNRKLAKSVVWRKNGIVYKKYS